MGFFSNLGSSLKRVGKWAGGASRKVGQFIGKVAPPLAEFAKGDLAKQITDFLDPYTKGMASKFREGVAQYGDKAADIAKKIEGVSSEIDKVTGGGVGGTPVDVSVPSAPSAPPSDTVMIPKPGKGKRRNMG